MNSNSRLVYSDELGSTCPHCGKALKKCCCRVQNPPSPGGGPIKIERQTKGRKGRGVSLISGLPLSDGELKQLAKELKQRCGCGGTVKDGVIEIQTDQRDLLLDELHKRGFQAKKAGG
jgi:translation initiation factor 1